MSAKILILAGDGINCERDTARAFTLAGGEPQIVHINDLLLNSKLLEQFDAIAFPGGFSFGDDLGSGQVLALKITSMLSDALQKFVQQKKPVVGICNGFQALTKLGLLPNPFEPRTMALARNSSGDFIDRWVELEADKKSICIWTKDLTADSFALPVRHGEGRVVFKQGEEEATHRQLSQNGQIALRYLVDVNGSYGRIAGVCDQTGLILGLMPHPEAAISKLQYPDSSRLPDRTAEGIGLKVFKNCVRYLKEK